MMKMHRIVISNDTSIIFILIMVNIRFLFNAKTSEDELAIPPTQYIPLPIFSVSYVPATSARRREVLNT